MRVEDKETQDEVGLPLTTFNIGDCVRLVHSDDSAPCGGVYIITTGPENRRAVNLCSGQHRNTGGFWLVLNAKVVIG